MRWQISLRWYVHNIKEKKSHLTIRFSFYLNFVFKFPILIIRSLIFLPDFKWEIFVWYSVTQQLKLMFIMCHIITVKVSHITKRSLSCRLYKSWTPLLSQCVFWEWVRPIDFYMVSEQVHLTMMGISLPLLNTCLAKDATCEGAC